ENPYRRNEKIYRSGDLAQVLPNGEMEYLGRIDFQVKIRGFRIELGEIENQLLKHPEINKAVVLAKTDNEGNRFLAAYIVSDRQLSVPELREHLLKDLPDYMVPQYFVTLDELPLTANGKVSRKDLPDPEQKISTGVNYVESRNEAEKIMVDIWQKVLGVEKVGILDNFFSLGGHSLKAVTLVAEMQKYFDVSVNDIFEYQNISSLAKNVKMRRGNLQSRIMELKKIAGEEENARREFMESNEASRKLEEYHRKNQKYKDLDLSETVKFENILLTGATGYLGVHVLQKLMEMKKSRVYVIVRSRGSKTSEDRLKEKTDYYFGKEFLEKYKNRITVLDGDLSKEKLGLIDREYEMLCNHIETIIHTAANVKHYGLFEEFYGPNVQAVLNLIELAKTGKKKDLNHISTLSVVEGHAEDTPHLLFSEYDLDLGQKSDNYYVKTKYQAEEEIMKAREAGLNAHIYRVGNISINSKTGHLQQNIEENAFFLQVRSFINLGVVPDQQDEVEFSFVDQLSKIIVLLFDRKNLKNETFNIWNSNMAKLSDILTSRELGLNVNRVTFPSFIDFLYNHYNHEYFKPYIESVMLHRGWLSKISEEADSSSKLATGFTILSEKTDIILEKTGFTWPSLDKAKMNKMVTRALKERIEFLQVNLLFRNMDSPELDLLARKAVAGVHEDETDILWEGEPNNHLHIIYDGNVELSRHNASGWLGTVGILGMNDFLGEETILKTAPSSLTAEAIMGDVTTLCFKGEDIRQILQEYPQLGINFVEALSGKLSKMTRVMVNLG
ncbi:MAG: SDR family oxidoreductase, partial [Vulcanimicrobiota bacterium]